MSAILLIHAPDRTGLVASVTDFIYKNNGNILHLDQHVDPDQQLFFMRVEWDCDSFSIPTQEIGASFEKEVAKRFDMVSRCYLSDEIPRVAIFVSKLSHCLYDLLSRYQSGEWQIKIPVIISNHPDMESVAHQFGIAYHFFQITSENKLAQETAQKELLKKERIALVILARYMQVLSDAFVAFYPNQIINIHHSFLPAFPGADPYRAAALRGVKIIGATSHYVTGDLDKGPIIEQDRSVHAGPERRVRCLLSQSDH